MHYNLRLCAAADKETGGSLPVGNKRSSTGLPIGTIVGIGVAIFLGLGVLGCVVHRCASRPKAVSPLPTSSTAIDLGVAHHLLCML